MRSLIAIAALLTAVPLAADAETVQPVPAPVLSLIGPVLRTAAPEKAVAFYRDGLGMQLAMTMEAGQHREYMLRFGSDMTAPGIVLIEDLSPEAPATVTHGDGFSRVVIRVSDLAALAARLDGAGYPHSSIRAVSHQYSMMMATDPDGYRLELVQNGAAAEAEEQTP